MIGSCRGASPAALLDAVDSAADNRFCAVFVACESGANRAYDHLAHVALGKPAPLHRHAAKQVFWVSRESA